jgi:hypothetical protein
MARWKVGTAVAAATLVIAGCGSGSSSSKAVSSFRRQANGICDRFTRQQNNLPRPGLTSSRQDMATYVTAIETSVGNEIAQLGAIKPPPSEKAAFDDALATARRDLARVKSEFGDVTGKSLTEIASAESAAAAAGTALSKKFAAAGLTSCGSKFNT